MHHLLLTCCFKDTFIIVAVRTPRYKHPDVRSGENQVDNICHDVRRNRNTCRLTECLEMTATLKPLGMLMCRDETCQLSSLSEYGVWVGGCSQWQAGPWSDAFWTSCSNGTEVVAVLWVEDDLKKPQLGRRLSIWVNLETGQCTWSAKNNLPVEQLSP